MTRERTTDQAQICCQDWHLGKTICRKGYFILWIEPKCSNNKFVFFCNYNCQDNQFYCAVWDVALKNIARNTILLGDFIAYFFLKRHSLMFSIKWLQGSEATEEKRRDKWWAWISLERPVYVQAKTYRQMSIYGGIEAYIQFRVASLADMCAFGLCREARRKTLTGTRWSCKPSPWMITL